MLTAQTVQSVLKERTSHLSLRMTLVDTWDVDIGNDVTLVCREIDGSTTVLWWSVEFIMQHWSTSSDVKTSHNVLMSEPLSMLRCQNLCQCADVRTSVNVLMSEPLSVCYDVNHNLVVPSFKRD